jgi:SAM-dependent methyltransferase
MNYSFPFEELLQSSLKRIYIFGAGLIGNHFQKQINEENWDGVNLGFIDNFLTTENVSDIVKQVGVYKPEILKTSEYDGVVLACSQKLIPEICETLFQIGVNSKKIIMPKLLASASITPNTGNAWNDYYDIAEGYANESVERNFIPLLLNYKISLNRVLDFPSGRGRIAESMYKMYADNIEKFVCCDANKEAINYCQKRFAGNNVFDFMVNKVDEWQCIPLEFKDSSFTFIYSWDSMVHFSYKWIDFYVSEFYRILENNGYVFIHHSNLASPDVKIDTGKSEDWNNNPHVRALVSANDVKYISEKHGFKVVEQNIINWIVPNLDCISLLRKH